MEEHEFQDISECLQNVDLPVRINLPTHQTTLRRDLIDAGQRRKTGFFEDPLVKMNGIAGMFGAAFRSPVFKPALTVLTVLALALALVPVLNNPAQVSASDIALADPQVRASFTPDELTRLNVQETDGSNGEKVVVLSCDAAVLAVGVDMAAGKVSEWLYNTVSAPLTAAPAIRYQLLFDSPITEVINNTNSVTSSSIFLVNTDGSDLIKLTDNSSRGYRWPDWSAESGKIVFTSDKNESIDQSKLTSNSASSPHMRQIYTMNTDGSDIKLLTWLYDALEPKWSPDGTKIVFPAIPEATPDTISAGKIDNDYEIYVMNADGSELTRLTDNYNPARPLDAAHAGPAFSGSNDDSPQWSPDGTKIIFISNLNGKSDIYAMHADGSGLTNLTNNPAADTMYSVAPGGKKIAFVSDRDGNAGTYAIYIMNIDGSGVTKLTQDNAEERALTWSPDGTKIAFPSKRDGKYEMYMANPDGTGLTKLTSNGARVIGTPSWSPDGKQIAFLARIDTTDAYSLYVMNSDGSGVTKLTDKTIWSYSWASLATYPVPVGWQGDTTLEPSEWHVTMDQAIAIAKHYLPASVLSQAKIVAAAAYHEGMPTISVSVSHISINKAELNWEKQFNMKGPPYDSSRPIIYMVGIGPYTAIAITISGIDGSVKSLWAFTKFG